MEGRVVKGVYSGVQWVYLVNVLYSKVWGDFWGFLWRAEILEGVGGGRNATSINGKCIIH